MSLPLCTACPHERPALWRSSDASEAGLCGDCIDLLVDIHAEAEAFDWERWLSATATEHCSFCGRRGDDAGGLLACTPPTFICSPCIERAEAARSSN